MMKKLFWLVLSTVILTGQSVFAQETNSETQSSQREDSLLQVVNELSGRVKKTEDAARNERIWKKRAKYFNIGYITNQTLTDKVDAEAEWKSDFGVSLAFGKTYYLHKKPLLNMIKFGIDATWFDISYAKYSEPDAYANDGAYTRAYGDYGGYDYDDEEDIDLTHPVIRQNIAYFIQSFELLAESCREVIRITLESLSGKEKDELTDMLEDSLSTGLYILSSQSIFTFTAEHSPLQGIREIYGKLYSLNLWGYPLKKFRKRMPDFDSAIRAFTENSVLY